MTDTAWHYPRRRWWRVGLSALVVLLSACRGEPIRYHTLLPPLGERASPGANIIVQALSVPAQVDRAQIVVREGDSSLTILEADWWGATLADEMKNALADQLGPRNSGTAKPVSVRVEVLRFDFAPGQYTLLDAVWRINGAENHPSLTCAALLREPAGASVDQLVSAQQRNIGQLAARIEASADSWRAGGGCP